MDLAADELIAVRLASMPASQTHSVLPQPKPQSHFAWRALEEIDYGLILASPQGHVQYANHLARRELALARFLRVAEQLLASPDPQQTGEILRGIRGAAGGKRQLLELQHAGDLLPMACVPLLEPLEGHPSSVLLMLGRQTCTQNLAVGFFARNHGLTPAEESVLRALCDGLGVQDIAITKGVTEATVRTQVRALRDKTCSSSIRRLVQRVAALPPVVPCALR